MTVEQRAELRRLLIATRPDASPLPWRWSDGQWGEGFYDANGAIVSVNSGRGAHDWDDEEAALALAAVNALPALLDALDAAEAESARLRSLLAGLAYDDGDLRASGEWVARTFQEIRAERDALRAELASLRSPAVSGALPSIEPFREFLDDDARRDLAALQAAVQRHDVECHYRRVSGWVEHGRITEPLRAEMAAVLREKEGMLP